MNKRMRTALLGVIVAVVLVGSGCSSGDDFPVTIDGQYVWTIGPFLCPILAGILDSQQTFTVNQFGEDVDWSFTDTNGSTVSFIGTYILDHLTGLMVILNSGTGGIRRIEAEVDMRSENPARLELIDAIFQQAVVRALDEANDQRDRGEDVAA